MTRHTNFFDLFPAYFQTALAVALIGAGASCASMVVFSGTVRDGFVFLGTGFVICNVSFVDANEDAPGRGSI